MKNKLQAGDALLIVDLQNDFLPGGSLAVTDGDKIIPIVNIWIKAAQEAGIPIIASRDWHPVNHISFKTQGGPWPSHCVQNTKGAEFNSEVQLPKETIIVDKAFTADKDAYSAMEGVTDAEGTPLPELLKKLKVKRIWIMGLAFDYCVHFSTLGARKLGYPAIVVLPGCRAIAKETEQQSFQEMAAAGVVLELDSSPYSS